MSDAEFTTSRDAITKRVFKEFDGLTVEQALKVWVSLRKTIERESVISLADHAPSSQPTR